VNLILVADTQVSISASENLATIGDKINIKILTKTSEAVDKISLNIPKKDFEILYEETIPQRKYKDHLVFETNFVISFFKTGDFTVGPLTVELIKNDKTIESKTTNSIPVKIKSVLKSEDKDIKNLKDLVPLKGNPLFLLKYVFIFLAVGIVALTIIFFIKKRKNKKKVELLPHLSPFEELEQQIKELMEKKLFEAGKIKEFFISLINIIKYFLYRQYQFNAEDLTTTETLTILEKKESETSIFEKLEFLFNISDLVKFAKFMPSSDELKGVMQKTNHMLQSYREKINRENIQENVSTGQ
jgi:hypothetical protein